MVRTVTAEYLLAMKLVSGREYKHDLSDVVGILLEHQKTGKPLRREDIGQAIVKLYGKSIVFPTVSIHLLNEAFENNDYEALYNKCLENEESARKVLTEFSDEYPNVLNARNIGSILSSLKEKQKSAGQNPLSVKVTDNPETTVTIEELEEFIADAGEFLNPERPERPKPR